MEWKDIPGYEGLYRISDTGSVFTIRFGKERKLRIGTNGYVIVSLSKNGIHKSVSVHTLVALTFLGKRPTGYTVHHKNENRFDNRADNLEYLLRSEHQRYHITKAHQEGRMKHIYATRKKTARRTKPYNLGTQNGNAKLTESIVVEILKDLESGIIAKVIARKFGVSAVSIYDIKYGKTWRQVTGKTRR